MALVKIPRNYQIIIYAVILVLAVAFLFYFFRQASIIPGDINQINLSPQQNNAAINQSAVNINLGLFDSQKFINLRSEVAPVTSFQTGKRNPFKPQ